MGIGVLPRNRSPEGNEQGKPIRGQGIGGLLFVMGCGLIYSESSAEASSAGAGLGLLLLLVGWGLIIPGKAVDCPAQ